jgi:quinol-cytochrome oxidoreductase complex cytochrome b subunit
MSIFSYRLRGQCFDSDSMVRLLNNHFTFYISYLGMNYSNVIGFLLFLVFILQFISGLLLSCYYSPFSTMAFDSVYYIMIDVNVGWLIRWLHCLGASLFMLFILIHWIRGAWIRLKVIDSMSFSLCFNFGWNVFSLSLIWVSGGVILSCSMIEGFLGYILNWGQMSYWGITVMINLLSILPLFGLMIAELIWCSCNVIINRIFVLHFSLGFLIGCFIFVHLFVLHSFSSSNPLLNSCSSLMIPFGFTDWLVLFCSCYFSFSLLFSLWNPLFYLGSFYYFLLFSISLFIFGFISLKQDDRYSFYTDKTFWLVFIKPD